MGPARAQRAVAGFLTLGEAPVERLTDKGVRRLDARAAVLEMDVVETDVVETDVVETDADLVETEVVQPGAAGAGSGLHAAATGHQDCAILRMVVLHTAPAVRPDDVLAALREQVGLVPSTPPMTTRLAQGPRALLVSKDVS